MISLNPFKKKEDDGFKLDEYSLPSLGDNSQDNTLSQNQENPFPQSQESSLGAQMPSLPQDNSNSLPTLSQNNPFSTSSSQQQEGVPGISEPMPSSFTSTPIESHIEETPKKENIESSSNDLTKAKLDTIATKIELMEARQSAMNQKLEQIYEMLALEVSPETKKRLKIKSMMDSIKE